MGNWLRTIFRPPVFADEEKTQAADLIYGLLLTLAGALIIVPLATFVFTPSEGMVILAASAFLLAAIVGLIVLVRRGRVRLAGALLALAFWLVVTASIATYRGVRDLTVAGYVVVIILTTLLLGLPGSLASFLLCVLSVVGVYLAELGGWITPHIEAQPALFQVLTLIVVMGLTAMLLRSAVRTMARVAERLRRSAAALAESQRQAEAGRLALEVRSRELERRTAQLEAAAEVGRAAASILEPEQLTQQVVQLIRDRFAFYHVALCLLDETGQAAEYCAGAGVAAEALLQERLRFALGDLSMIGWSIANAQMRVAQDARLDRVRLDHPLLPDTRSEAVFPLIARGQVLGALDVQSDQTGAFDEGTLSALQLIADQVAVALSNARLFAESEQALEMMRRVYGEIEAQTWRELLRRRGELGYLYTRRRVEPAGGEWDPAMRQAVESGQPVWGEGRRSLVVPLRVRDRVVGAFQLRKEEAEGSWSDEEARLIGALAERLGLALESARLYQDTQDRAAREQLVREITDKMRRAVDMESLFRITVGEIMAALDAPEVFVQLAAPPEEGRQAGGA